MEQTVQVQVVVYQISRPRTRVRLAFIFGRLFGDEQSEKHLREESKLHGDVIQGDFGESYSNMTLKSLTGLHWASTYCSSSR